MLNNLIKRILRNFLIATLTPETVERVIKYVLEHVKAVTPDVVDKWLDSLDTKELATLVVDFVLNAVLPTLPILSLAASKALLANVTPTDVEKEAEAVTREVKAALRHAEETPADGEPLKIKKRA
jgi:hypothetical protein